MATLDSDRTVSGVKELLNLMLFALLGPVEGEQCGEDELDDDEIFRVSSSSAASSSSSSTRASNSS